MKEVTKEVNKIPKTLNLPVKTEDVLLEFNKLISS